MRRDTIGDSAPLIELSNSFLSHVLEGLGTKSLVADAMYALTGELFFDRIGQCALAMVANDAVTSGALPYSAMMHLAVRESSWFEDKDRADNLIQGWKLACQKAKCAWIGGETPTLKGIIEPGAFELSGSTAGFIKPKKRRILGNVKVGDAIILVVSNGIHANGLTLGREIADKLPAGFLTLLPDGRTYGETLLDPTHLYVAPMEDCLNAGVEIHYAINITGHGWRKLMRLPANFRYVVEELPPSLPIFEFIQKNGPVNDYNAFFDLNMGAGFALIAPESEVKEVVEIFGKHDLLAFRAGPVEEGERSVVIKPKDLVFGKETLSLR